jgi:ankyrin repeat protein
MSEKLHAAIAAGDEEAVRGLVDARPELAGERNAAGLSPVLQALYNGKRDLVDVLLDANPALDVFDAAAVGRVRGLEELLAGDAELARAWSPDGFTALHYAAFFGEEQSARLLLENGAEVGLVARNENIHVTPLHSAAAGGHAEIVRLLLEHGADPNAAQDGGATPLHSAAQNDDRESVEALLEAGADPTLATDEGKRPADLAGDGVGDLLG